MKIYFKNADTSTLEKLLKSFYINEYARPTYTDEKCMNVECAAKRRSFEDLYSISKTYFPETTEEQLLQALINIDILFYHCSTINKLVFHYAGSFRITKHNLCLYSSKPYVDSTYTPRILVKILENLNN